MLAICKFQFLAFVDTSIFMLDKAGSGYLFNKTDHITLLEFRWVGRNYTYSYILAIEDFFSEKSLGVVVNFLTPSPGDLQLFLDIFFVFYFSCRHTFALMARLLGTQPMTSQ